MPRPPDFDMACPEREMLGGFLDWQRATVEAKVDGLSLEDASRPMTPSGLSLLGVVKHLGWVEYYWFRWVLAGEEVEPPPREDGNNAVQFRVETEDSVDSVLAFYRSECAHARRVTAAAATLEQPGVRASRIMGTVSLRWILIHMVEETARHAGHMDLMREAIDGSTGYA